MNTETNTEMNAGIVVLLHEGKGNGKKELRNEKKRGVKNKK